MAVNASVPLDLPPLPNYTLYPRESFIPGVSDAHFALALPIIAYWAFSMMYHACDVYNVFEKYRLHTPAELKMRNRVTRWEVVRDVILQQIIQTIAGLAVSHFDPIEMAGCEEYDVSVWARRIRIAQKAIPSLLTLVGVNAAGLAKSVSRNGHVMLAGALAGGSYPDVLQSLTLDNGAKITAPAFTSWELALASFIYWYLIPGLQFTLAVCIVDTWQYALHRTMHVNKWLYATFHSRHHRLYVPYAFGALYNHPVEGFLLDTLGTGIGFLVAGMTNRQAILFFTFSTMKTVDDHCGYALPFDPLQILTPNNAAYHDIHHQSWGIKTNFSQPFFTFWDSLLGTQFKGEVKLRYERGRETAQKLVDNEASKAESSAENHESAVVSTDGPATRTRLRRKTVDSLKGTSHGVPGSVLHN